MTRRVYRFGDCNIDIPARELRRADDRIDVPPRVFDCIAYLLEQSPRAVGRDELVSAVWGKTDITDSLLAKTLVKARRAVGDTGDEQLVIRTIPRFGYLWVAATGSSDELPQPARRDPDTKSAAALTLPNAQVSTESPTAVAQNAGPPASERDGVRRKTLLRLSLAVFGVLLLGLIASRINWHSPPTSVAAPIDTMRYGVLPVTVQGADDDAWLRLGLMDLIANHLRDAGLAVIPSDNVVRVLHDEQIDAAAITNLRAATGARDLILSRARHTGKDWIVTLSLESADGATREVEARANDAIPAARLAGDRLLAVLGHPSRSENEITNSLTERIQRIEAAVLINDFDQARRWIVSASPAMQASPELQLRLATIDYRLGRSDEAQSRLETLLGNTAIESAPVLRGRALTILGGIALKQSAPDIAEPHLLAAIPLLETTDAPVATGHAYMGLAICRAMQARYDEAATALARARIAFELGGDTHAFARVDINEGAMLTMRDRQAAALPLLERAAERFQRLDAPGELINALGNQVEAQLALLQPAQALAISERMVPLFARLENINDRYIYLALRARALEAVGRSSEARLILGDITQAVDPNRDRLLLAQVRATQARLDLSVSQPGTAYVLASQSVAALSGAEYARIKAETWRIAILALLKREQYEEATNEVERFNAWSVASQSGSSLARLAAAEVQAAMDIETAWPIYAEALSLANRHAVPNDIASVAISYASRLIASGRLADASDLSGQVARWADRDFASALLQVRLYQALGQTEAWQQALARVNILAGERPVPADLLRPPAQRATIGKTGGPVMSELPAIGRALQSPAPSQSGMP